jgi:hypothetical protein
MATMRIELYDFDGRPQARLVVDPKSPPSAVSVPGPREVLYERYLDWDRALDDQGRLRKCPACGCPELYVRRLFPPLTGFVVVMVIGLLCFALYGLEVVPTTPLLVIGALIVLANIIFALLSPRYLVCYSCSSRYHDTKISRDHGEWDAAVAARHPPPAARARNSQFSM